MAVDWMALAIAYSHRSSAVYPSPSVACIVVSDGEEVVRAVSDGPAHAEATALAALADKGVAASDCVFYMNLEPCGERGQGATPCADLLIQAGAREVHYAIEDPYIRTKHVGHKKMEDAGVTVVVGEHAVAALLANEDYFHRFCPNCGWVLRD